MNQQLQFSAATSIFCRVMQLLTLGGMGFIGYLIATHTITQDMAWANFRFLSQDQANLVIVSDFKTQLLSYIMLAPIITPIFVLLGVFRVFGRFASRPFRLDKAGQVIRFLGMMVVLKALLDFAFQPVSMLIMTYDNPPGSRALAYNFHPEHLTYLLLGFALFTAGNLTRSAAVIGGLSGDHYDPVEEAEEELAEAEAELEEAQEELAEAEADLEAADTPEDIEEALEDIAEAKEEIIEAKAEIEGAKAELAAAVDDSTDKVT